MRNRSLLVTFDAWKTLFTPRESIAAQYTRVAREHGISADVADVREGFKKAFAAISTAHPNYGKTTGMTPEQWWTIAITGAFSPTPLPATLAPALLSHFSTSAAYTLHTSVPFLLKSLRSNDLYDTTVLGVISNSDTRVPPVLRSLGISVGGIPQHGENGAVDFVTLSYDVGVEKPDPKIFLAAENEAELVGGRGREWVRVHVGDDFEKDVEAARNVGWRGILWDGEGRREQVLEMILNN